MHFSIFGGLIMKLFGFQYESISSLTLFFVIVGVLGYPLELIAQSLPKALLTLNKINTAFAKILFIFLDAIFTIVTMKFVDYFMGSVLATDISIFIIALIIAFIGAENIYEK
ncbi:MAG: YrvL family regulatory protein [bacterium]